MSIFDVKIKDGSQSASCKLIDSIWRSHSGLSRLYIVYSKHIGKIVYQLLV
jgi:hypothetical protein